MKKICTVALVVLSTCLVACSSKPAQASSIASVIKETTAPYVETTEGIKEIELPQRHAGTRESDTLEKSKYADDFRALDYGETKVIYEAPEEKDSSSGFDEAAFFKSIYDLGFDKDEYNQIAGKKQNADGGWDVYVTWNGNDEVKLFVYHSDRTLAKDNYRLGLFNETILPSLQTGSSSSESSKLKMISADEMKTIYPYLPWDEDVVRPTNIKLMKTADERCGVIFTYPNAIGVTSTGLSQIDYDTTYAVRDMAGTTMVPEYLYLVHDVSNNDVYVVFSDRSNKYSWYDCCTMRYRFSDDGITLIKVGKAEPVDNNLTIDFDIKPVKAN